MGFLVALGVLGIFLALSNRRGGSAPPLEDGSRFLFEGRYYTAEELRAYLRQKYDALARAFAALDYERGIGPISAPVNRRFLDEVHALGLEAQDLASIDATMEAMRRVSISSEAAYRALAYYVSTRGDGALVDPYAGDDLAAVPVAALEARADEVERDQPALAEQLRDVAEVRRAVDEAAAPAPAAPAAPPPAAAAPSSDAPRRLTAAEIAALSFGDLGDYLAGSQDPAGWAELESRLRAMTDGQLGMLISGLETRMAGASDQRRLVLQGVMDRARAIIASRQSAPTTTSATAGPAGYDPDLAHRLAPAVAAAIRSAPYSPRTQDLVRRFQVAAFGGTGDGKYGGKTKGALRYYGVSNPPNALYRPTAEVAYVAPN